MQPAEIVEHVENEPLKLLTSNVRVTDDSVM